ncbi:phosphoribosylanthranilate isomerase [Desulforudis sp. 1088]|uniref:phosphoribosylanthranilate isomerase n=1 Tax=unclassified Candidatus Desulforudis TaxID=2635950 RepID=UPI003CE46568
MVRVKICGIRDEITAQAAVEAGADALGFVFAPSPRRIEPEAARAIIAGLPPFVCAVGVFVDAPAEAVRAIAARCGLQVLQFHGNEPPDYCTSFDRPVIKALRFCGPDDLARIRGFDVRAVLVDTFVPGQAGGTGRALDWAKLRGLDWPRPLVLAGGLTPENVASAVAAVRPWAVDVSSGVETGGAKDHEKIRAFIRNAKGGSAHAPQ